MKAPENTKIVEMYANRFWFEGENLLLVVAMNVPEQPLSEVKKQFDSLKELIGDKKICMIVDLTNAGPSGREAQNFNAREFPKILNAVAFVTRSALGKMLAHLYMGLKPSPFPSKVFSNEKEAREWISQYLQPTGK